jgi:hypothetical protein
MGLDCEEWEVDGTKLVLCPVTDFVNKLFDILVLLPDV